MRSTIAPAPYTAAAFARVVAALPDAAVALTAIQDTAPKALWLIHQGRANVAARTMLGDDGAEVGFAIHTAAVLHPVSLGALNDAVTYALDAQTGGPVLSIDRDTALATLMYVAGRSALDPDVYRRAVAPLVQAGAEVPYHPAETPDGKPEGEQWERGCSFRAGYRQGTHGEPLEFDRIAEMHPDSPVVFQFGYDAAKADQAP